MANFDPAFENIIWNAGAFQATEHKNSRHYLYWYGERVGEINSGKHPTEVYGSFEKWVKHIVGRSQKRVDKINDTLVDLNVEKARLDRILKEAALVLAENG